MKERSILFFAQMVQAILHGHKGQTRRIIKPQPAVTETWLREQGAWQDGHSLSDQVNEAWQYGFIDVKCPYGEVGDQLWVKETHYQYGHWEPVDTKRTRTGRQKWKFVPDLQEFIFDAPENYRKGRHHKDPATPAWHKRSSLFMPRHAARIFLEITDIRVQNLQGISEEDAILEGISRTQDDCAYHLEDQTFRSTTARRCFAHLFEHINGDGTWEQNPFVWAISFKRVKQ